MVRAGVVTFTLKTVILLLLCASMASGCVMKQIPREESDAERLSWMPDPELVQNMPIPLVDEC